jgi:hypothetical protein
MSASYHESQHELEELRNAYLRAIAEINAALPRSEAPDDESDGDTVVAENAPVDTPPPRGPVLIRTRGGHLVRQTAIGLSPALLPEPAAEGPWIRRDIVRRNHPGIWRRIYDELGERPVTYEAVRAELERAIDNESVPGAMIFPYVEIRARTDGLGQGFSITLADETAATTHLRPIDSFDGLTRNAALEFLTYNYILTAGSANASTEVFENAKVREGDLYDNMVGLLIK